VQATVVCSGAEREGRLNAQDLAVGREARARGLLDPERLARATQSWRGASDRLPQVLVRERLISGADLSRLLEDLRAGGFGCQGCRTTLSFDHLATLPSLHCPQCGGELQFYRGAIVSSSSHPGAAPFTTLPEPGSRLGPWLLVSELGKGSYGVVFLAQKEGLARQFALKVLRPEVADAEAVARFRLEAAAASKVEDPGVVGVFDIGEQGPFHYYAMEHCPGPTLKERLDQGGPLPWREAARLVATIARTIAAAHRAGVIHRDLKPANVILEASTGRPRVTDFGLARAADLARSLTQSGDMIGTPLFMSPEQLRGEKAREPLVDVYALGAIFYYTLTGSPPHDAPSLATLTEKVLNEEVRPPDAVVPGIPRGLSAICLRALRREPGARTRSAEAFAQELEAFLARDAARPAPGPRRSRAPLLLALGAVALVSAGAGVAFVTTRDPGAEVVAAPAPPAPPVAPVEPAPAPVVAPTPPPVKLEWGIAYYMPYDNRLSDQGPRILAALAEASTSPQLAVAVQADFQGPGGLSRFLPRPVPDGAALEPVERLPDVESSCDPATFRAWLDWVERTLDAPRLALVLLGMGGKMGQSCYDTFAGGGGPTATSAWLDLPDVAGALTSFRERLHARGAEVELIFFQQAGRGQLENLHALRGAARVVMASQATLGAPNHYYGRALAQLATTPTMNGRELALAIAEGDTPDMFSSYSALSGAALEELPARLEPVLEGLVGLDRVRLDRGAPLAEWVTFNVGDQEVFVDGLALLRALVRENSRDPAPLDAFEAWCREELVVVRVTSPVAPDQVKRWCGFSLLLPLSEDGVRPYLQRYPLVRTTRLRDLWAKLLEP
jgi:hypothetical protein